MENDVGTVAPRMPELEELSAALGQPKHPQDSSTLPEEDQTVATPEEDRAAATSRELAKKYHPSQVPYLNDAYTWQDRQEELELLQKLLDFRLRTVAGELQAVREINAKREYPNIAFQH